MFGEPDAVTFSVIKLCAVLGILRLLFVAVKVDVPSYRRAGRLTWKRHWQYTIATFPGATIFLGEDVKQAWRGGFQEAGCVRRFDYWLAVIVSGFWMWIGEMFHSVLHLSVVFPILYVASAFVLYSQATLALVVPHINRPMAHGPTGSLSSEH